MGIENVPGGYEKILCFLRGQLIGEGMRGERAVFAEVMAVILHFHCLNKVEIFDEQMGCLEKALMMIPSIGMDEEVDEDEGLTQIDYKRTIW